MICYRDCTIAEAGRAICCPELGDDPIATMSQLDWQIKRKEQSGPCKNKQEPSRQPVNWHEKDGNVVKLIHGDGRTALYICRKALNCILEEGEFYGNV